MKTYTITTGSGREIAKNIGPDKLFDSIPSGYSPSAPMKKLEKPHQVFKKRVGPDQFETLIVVEDDPFFS